METISGIKDPAFKQALSLIGQTERTQTKLYLAETANIVHQALRSESEVVSVFAMPEDAQQLRQICSSRNVPLYITGSGLINKLVGTGYGVAVTAICVVRQRSITFETLLRDKQALILVGEKIQDPRNVGVLVRTAEAAGCSALLLSANSAEAYSRAAVRSSTGSILRLPICFYHDLPAALREMRAQGGIVIATSARAPKSVYEADLTRRPLAVVVGNESDGITEETRNEAGEFVSLPMVENGPSSLNVTVAAGVLLYEAVRQTLRL